MANILFDRLMGNMARPDHTIMDIPGDRQISYAALHAETGRIANALTSFGVGAGDRVAVQVDKSVEAIALYLATVRAGAIFLPLNTGYTPAELTYFLGDATPAVFVCRSNSRDGLTPIASQNGATILTLDADGSGTLMAAAHAADSAFNTVARGEDDLAAILYTSGTTGRSKGAMLSHKNLVSNSECLAEYWDFTPDDVLLHALPIYHTHGLFVATNITLMMGGTMIFLAGFNADQVIANLPRATAMMGVPTFYTRLLDRPDFTHDLVGNMRLFISGSAPLLAETHRQFSDRTGMAILERYGMTETNMNTSNPYDGDRRPGTVGFPLPGVELRVRDEKSGDLLGTGEIGVLEVRGDNVFKGYWQMPEKTASEFRPDGFFITGDLGVVDDDGYVSIVGRGKDLIISGGFNVYPKEVEQVIDDLPGVLESAVIGVAHPDFGEGVTAIVVLEPGADVSEQAVISSLSDQLAKFKQPKRVFFLPELPRNTMGKVQKVALREDYKDLYTK